jgi:hypothetical protein
MVSTGLLADIGDPEKAERERCSCPPTTVIFLNE